MNMKQMNSEASLSNHTQGERESALTMSDRDYERFLENQKRQILCDIEKWKKYVTDILLRRYGDDSFKEHVRETVWVPDEIEYAVDYLLTKGKRIDQLEP